MFGNEKDARIKKFQREFDANDTLTKHIVAIMRNHSGKLKLRGTIAEKDLDLAVAVMFSKAEKTYEAILELCARGFGEDATTLLRGNVNLMINLYYVLAEDSVNRASAFIAHGHSEQAKYLRLAHRELPEDLKRLDWGKIEKLAAQWRAVTIETKAEKAKQQYHYNVGYRFYSSIEHSDAWALSRYVTSWDEVGPKIGGEPSDTLVDIALPHNFWVMANVFLKFCAHFKLEVPEIEKELDDYWQQLFHDRRSDHAS